jgi:hypothetical protein
VSPLSPQHGASGMKPTPRKEQDIYNKSFKAAVLQDLPYANKASPQKCFMEDCAGPGFGRQETYRDFDEETSCIE